MPTTPAEREAEIERVARQLARIAETVPWGRVQNNRWDSFCHFIFRLRAADHVRERAAKVAAEQGLPGDEFIHYVLRRWYCFWGARVAELLFHGYPNVTPGPPKDHEIDFTIDGVNFDLKTSELPSAFVGRLSEIRGDPAPLARWFYQHQSRERRFHLANRLFLVLCDPEEPGEAWRLRADVGALRASVDRFMRRPNLLELILTDPSGAASTVVTGVVFVDRPASPRQLRLSFAPPPGNLTREPPPPALESNYQLGLPFG